MMINIAPPINEAYFDNFVPNFLPINKAMYDNTLGVENTAIGHNALAKTVSWNIAKKNQEYEKDISIFVLHCVLCIVCRIVCSACKTGG